MCFFIIFQATSCTSIIIGPVLRACPPFMAWPCDFTLVGKKCSCRTWSGRQQCYHYQGGSWKKANQISGKWIFSKSKIWVTYFHFEIIFILFSQGTPRNIYRHVILSDIKDATTSLPRVRTIKIFFFFLEMSCLSRSWLELCNGTQLLG